MSGLTLGWRTDTAASVRGAAATASAARGPRSDEPLLRNGHLLSASSVLTSVLGAGYWALATRLYPVDEVGRNYAAVSAMLFLAGVGQLNLTNVLVRFVPVAAGRTGRLVARAYAAAFGITLLLAVGFVLLLPDLSPGLDFLHHPLVGAGFEFEARVGDVHFSGEDGNAYGLDVRDRLADKREENVEVVDHDVEDDVDIQTASAENAEAMHFEKQRTFDEFFRGENGGIEAFDVADLENAGVFLGCRDKRVGFAKR